MGTPTGSGSRLHAAVAALALLLATIAGAAAPAAGAPTTSGVAPATSGVAPATSGVATVLTPSVLPLSGPEIPNPDRGLYRWMGQNPVLPDWPAPDLYHRDQVYWGTLEPVRGQYDFSALEAGLADAAAVRGTYSFRVMAYCPGCWMNTRPDRPPVTPPFIPLQAGSDVPDWNSETFLSSWEALMAELGRRYGSDPRIGSVDIGGVGKFGEWMPAGTDVTDVNARRVITAVAQAFPTRPVLLGAATVYLRPALAQWAVATHPRLGLRADCLGAATLQVPTAAFADVWRTRPYVTEWCTHGDPLTARDQVLTHHISTVSSGNLRLAWSAMTAAQQAAYVEAVKRSGYRYAMTRAAFSPAADGRLDLSLTVRNDGVAPTYDDWTLRLVLTSPSGQRVAALPLDIDLRGVLPGSRTFTRSLSVPAVPAADYGVSVEALDPTGYSAPLRLANAGRASDGSYAVGTLPLPLLPAPATSWPRDVTGDGAPDVVVVEATGGALRVYPTDGSGRWRAPVRTGSGWHRSVRVLTAGTWDADGVSDLIAQNGSGALLLHRGRGDGSFGAAERIGAGWQVMNHVAPLGDFDGDGSADLLARRSTGELYVYRGSGTGGFAARASVRVGTGWNIYSAIFSPGDFDGDGQVDVLARTRAGVLYLYRGNGRGGWAAPRRQIGSGWQGFTALTSPGDVDGDGDGDVLARDRDGTLWLYRGNDRGGWQLPRRAVGRGWNVFSTLTL